MDGGDTRHSALLEELSINQVQLQPQESPICSCSSPEEDPGSGRPISASYGINYNPEEETHYGAPRSSALSINQVLLQSQESSPISNCSWPDQEDCGLGRPSTSNG